MDLWVVVWTLVAMVVAFLVKVAYGIVSFYWVTPRRIRRMMEKQGVSGPKPRWLMGNVPDMAAMVAKSTTGDHMETISHDIVPRLLPHYLYWSKIYGKRFIYWNGVEPRMCLAEAELIKELLAKHSMVTGKSWMQRQGNRHFIGRGLLMANGEEWYHRRRIVAPAFNGNMLKSYAVHMVESTKEMLKSLAVKSGETTEVEIGEYMTRLTAEIISRTEIDSSYEKGKQIFQMLRHLQQLVARATTHLWFPGSRFVPSKYNREIKSLKKEMERQLMQIIQSRKDGVEVGRSSSYGRDLLGMLLDEMNKSSGTVGGSNLDLQVIMDEIKTFIFAGHDTTALLLTWTVMLLATNTDWQQKVRAEVREVCGGDGVPSVDHLSKLTLLNMVINESLRLYPPASLLPRVAFQDMQLGDLFIPKGLSIWIPVLVLHHNKEIWGMDADKFNPTRFASRPPGLNWHFIPFAAGPRNCVGQSFALMEVKIILAMLVTKFNFIISKNYRHNPVLILTLKPKYGVQVYLKPLTGDGV